LAQPAAGQPAAGQPAAGQLASARYDAGNERYEQARLPNGLSVYLAEDHRVPLVGISVSYPVGKTLDPAEAPGTADLIATLLPILGTRHLPDGPSDLIGAAGFYQWDVGGWARTDETRLELVVPAAAVDLALFIEAERMGFVTEGVTGPSLEWAKKKTSEAFEAQSGGERGSELSQQLLYGPQHPYGSLNAAPNLGKVDVNAVRQRLRRYYSVSGARLAIVGDIDSTRLLSVVQRTFGRLQGLPAPVPVLPAAPPAAPKQGEVRSATVFTGFSWAWRTPRFLAEDDISLDVAARYLSHRLAQRLATGATRAHVGARQTSVAGGSVFWLFAKVEDQAQRPAIERAVRDEIDSIAAGKIDTAELQIAKTQIIGDIASDMDDLQARARFLLSYARLYDKLDGFQPHLASYAQLDAARLAKVVREYLTPSPVTINYVNDPKAKKQPQVSPRLEALLAPPVASGELITPDAPEWYRPPAAIVVPRFDPPRIFEESVGKSRLLFMPRFGLPTVKLRVALNWQGPVVIPSVRELLLDNLLRAKAAGRPALRDRLADLGATLSVSNDTDSASFVVTALVDQGEQAMAALRDTLELEHFDKADFAATHTEAVKDEAEAKSNEWRLVGRWLERLTFPANHRYHVADVADAARSLMLQRLDQSQLEAFWKGERRAESLTVSIVGPVDEARARAWAQAGLPRFPAGKPLKARPLNFVRGLLAVHEPGVTDVRVQFSWAAPAWGSDAHASSLALRWLFGDRGSEGLPKFLRDNGVATTDDWYANLITERDLSRLVFSVRIPKAELAGLLKAVPLYVASLQRGTMTWEAVQEARREAVQWVTGNFEGAKGCLSLLASQSDFAVAASSASDFYLLAQRIDKKSLAKAAAILDSDRAQVIVYGPVADVDALGSYGFGEPRRFSAENPGKAP